MKKPKKNQPKSSPASVSGESRDTSFVRAAGTPAPRSSAKVVVGEVGPEPVAGRASVPVLLIALLGLLVYFGDMYVVNHGGELDARVHQPFHIVRDLEDLQPKGADDILKAKGQKIYKQYCSACHQDDGNGNPSAGIPPLAGSDWLVPKDPSRIIRIVLNGLSGPIVVNGKQWGQAAMLPWRDALTDDDVAAVLTYVRSGWGNKGPAVKAEDVKKIRDATKDKGGNWTGDELLQIPLKD